MREKLRPFVPYALLCENAAFKSNRAAFENLDDIEKAQAEVYFMKAEKELDWETPDTYSGKMMINKIYCATPEKTRDTDKIRVRERIKDEIGEQYLIPVIGIYDKLSQVNFKELPDQFVIKCSHDCHSVKIITDKNALSKKEWKRTIDEFDHYYLKRKMHRQSYELHYAGIEPKIIIEKYMGDNINDYKFLCFSGKPYYCWVDTGRFTSHMRSYYDMEWNKMEFYSKYILKDPKTCEKPENFKEMISVAEKLSKGYDHVRVDLYDIKGKVYFGELTFTSNSGYDPIVPDEWDTKMGDLWNFDYSKRTEIRKKYSSVKEFCKNW